MLLACLHCCCFCYYYCFSAKISFFFLSLLRLRCTFIFFGNNSFIFKRERYAESSLHNITQKKLDFVHNCESLQPAETFFLTQILKFFTKKVLSCFNDGFHLHLHLHFTMSSRWMVRRKCKWFKIRSIPLSSIFDNFPVTRTKHKYFFYLWRTLKNVHRIGCCWLSSGDDPQNIHHFSLHIASHDGKTKENIL